MPHVLRSIALTLLLTACSTMPQQKNSVPLVPNVDVPRFMGDWYVIAYVPTFIDRGGHNQVESYKLNDDGTIATTFRFRADRFDGKLKTYHPKGFVREGTGNALWGMQFVWPIKGEYRIAYLEPDYSATIVARSKRDYVWLLARTPDMSDAQFQRHMRRIREMGYDLSKVQRVPQRWPEPAESK